MMNVEALFFRLAKPKLRKQRAANASRSCHFTYENLGSSLFLIDWKSGGEAALGAAQAFCRRARGSGLPLSLVEVVVFNAREEVPCVSLTRKDFSWRGLPRGAGLKALLARPYDLLVDYSDGENPYLKRVLTLAQAAVKVGYATGEATTPVPYDFALRLAQPDYERYNQHIFDYLRCIIRV